MEPTYPWSDARKLEYALEKADQLMVSKPHLAVIWLKSADMIRNKIASLGGNSLT